MVEDGGTVEQETLHFDPRTGALSSLRSKEEAHDYRYFPEPDLVPIAPTEEMIERARAALPELPAAARRADGAELGLQPDTARLLAFRGELGDYYERRWPRDGADPKAIANWVTGELVARIGDARSADDQASSRPRWPSWWRWSRAARSRPAAKEVLGVLVEEGGEPAAIVEDARPGHGRRRRAGRDRGPGDGGERRRRGEDQGRQRQGHRRHHRGRDEGDQGPADGGEVQRLVREKLGV